MSSTRKRNFNAIAAKKYAKHIKLSKNRNNNRNGNGNGSQNIYLLLYSLDSIEIDLQVAAKLATDGSSGRFPYRQLEICLHGTAQ